MTVGCLPQYTAFLEEYKQLCLKYSIYIDNPVEKGRLMLDYIDDDNDLEKEIDLHIRNILE